LQLGISGNVSFINVIPTGKKSSDIPLFETVTMTSRSEDYDSSDLIARKKMLNESMMKNVLFTDESLQ
jgi:hypothetical protein